MTEPKQLRVLTALSEHLEGVHPDQADTPVPYTVDLRGRVSRGRAVFTVEESINRVSILEALRTDGVVTPTEKTTSKRRLQLLLQGWAEDDPLNPSDPAYRLLAMVEHRLALVSAEDPNGALGGLYPAYYNLSGEVTSLDVGQGVVRPAAEDSPSRVAMFFLPVTVSFVMHGKNPWS